MCFVIRLNFCWTKCETRLFFVADDNASPLQKPWLILQSAYLSEKIHRHAWERKKDTVVLEENDHRRDRPSYKVKMDTKP